MTASASGHTYPFPMTSVATDIAVFHVTEKGSLQIALVRRNEGSDAFPGAWGFRVLKSDIEIAPVHHRLPDRIRAHAHAMICFLALVLYRVMRMRLKAKGHSASPRTALDLLERIQRHTTNTGGRTLEGLSTITPEQLELFNTLDLPKPA